MTLPEMSNGLKKRGFWDFNIGHVLLLLGMFGAFLVWWETFGSLPRETAAAVALTSATLNNINEKGTLASRLAIAAQTRDIASLDARVTVVEHNYSSLNDKITDVQTKLNVVAALLEADKKKK